MEIEEIPSNYRSFTVGSDTIMDLGADITGGDTVSIYIKVDFDDDDEEDKESFDRFSFTIPEIVSGWRRELLSWTMDSIPHSQRRKDRLAVWEETVFYHLDLILRYLYDPDSDTLYDACFFKIDFVSKSPQAMEELGLSTSAGPPGLLKRIESYDDDNKRCSICWDDFDDEQGDAGKDLTCMPCSHAFHYNCLSEWLPRSQTCPVCRHDLNWKTVVEDMPSYP